MRTSNGLGAFECLYTLYVWGTHTAETFALAYSGHASLLAHSSYSQTECRKDKGRKTKYRKKNAKKFRNPNTERQKAEKIIFLINVTIRRKQIRDSGNNVSWYAYTAVISRYQNRSIHWIWILACLYYLSKCSNQTRKWPRSYSRRFGFGICLDFFGVRSGYQIVSPFVEVIAFPEKFISQMIFLFPDLSKLFYFF